MLNLDFMFKCPKCCKSFTSQYNVNIHLNKKVPCILEENKEDNIKCDFCNMGFSSNSNLNKHLLRCVVRKTPELLVKQIEKQKELLQQQNTIIEQKDIIIEDLQKNTKIHEVGKLQNANTINDNSTNSTNITNITNIYNNTNVTLYAFRRADMIFALDRYKKDNKVDFVRFSHEIYDYIRKNDLKSIIRLTFRHLHDNSHFKRGHNIVYCNSGEHKGKFLTFNNSNEFIGWYVTNIKVIVKVICKEISKIIELKMSMDDTNDARKHAKDFTEKDHEIIGKFEQYRHDLLKHPKFQQYAIAIIKEHVSRKNPKPVHTDLIESKIPFDNDLSHNASNDDKKKKKLKFNDASSESSESSSEELSSIHSDDSACTKMKKRGVGDYKGSNSESSSDDESSIESSSESSSEEQITAEQRKRNIENEKARQKRKAEEADEERKEETYKRKCETDGTEYVSKAERIAREHYLKQQKLEKESKKNKKNVKND